MADNLKAKLELDPGGYARGMRTVKQVSARTATSVAGSFRSAARTLTSLPALLTGGFAAINIAKAIGVSSAAGEIRSKFDAVYKDLASENRAFADDFAKAFGRSAIALESQMARMQDTFVPFGFARDAAAGLSKQITTLAYDLSSFNDVAEDMVIADLQSALVGNHETMRKYGVVISETTLKAEGLRMGIASAKGEMTQQAKVLARLSIIMRGTSDAQGDLARTAGSWANQSRRAASMIEDLYRALGDYVTQSKTAAGALTGFGNTLADITTYLDENRKAGIEFGDTFVSSMGDSNSAAVVLSETLTAVHANYLRLKGGLQLVTGGTRQLEAWGARVLKALTPGDLLPGVEAHFADQVAAAESAAEGLVRAAVDAEDERARVVREGEERVQKIKDIGAERDANRQADAAEQAKKAADDKVAAEKKMAAAVAEEARKLAETVKREGLDKRKANLEKHLAGQLAATQRSLAKREQEYKKYCDALDRLDAERKRSEESFEETMFRRETEGMTDAEKEKAYRGRGKDLAKRGREAEDPEERRRLLKEAQDAYLEADRLARELGREREEKGKPKETRGIKEYKKLQREIEDSFDQQMEDMKDKAFDAGTDVAGLRAELEQMKADLAEPAALTLDAEQAITALEAVKAELAELKDKEIHVKVVRDGGGGNEGGEGMASGGWVGGQGNGDTVPAWLTPGEFVVNRQAAASNRAMLDHINARGYAAGGAVTNTYGPITQQFTMPVDRASIRGVVIPEIERARSRGRV